MYVCLCKNVTDGQIQEAVANGANSMRDITSKLQVATQCGKCGTHAKQIFKQLLPVKTVDACSAQ